MNNLFYCNNQCISKQLPPPPHNKKEPKKEPPKKKKNKIDFKKIKKNTFTSLNEVECFLNNFHTFTNYIKLYKILK